MTQKETAKAKHMASEIVKNYFKDMKIKTFSTSSFALCCVYDKDFENDWKELLQQMGQAVKNEKIAVFFLRDAMKGKPEPKSKGLIILQGFKITQPSSVNYKFSI